MESPQSYLFFLSFSLFFFSLWGLLGENLCDLCPCQSYSGFLLTCLAYPPLASHEWLESEHRLACAVRKATLAS